VQQNEDGKQPAPRPEQEAKQEEAKRPEVNRDILNEDSGDENQIKEKQNAEPPSKDLPQQLLVELAKVFARNSGTPAKDIDVRSSLFAEAAQVIVDYAEVIIKQYPELMDSCRDLFREVIYSVYDSSKLKDEEFVKRGGSKKGEEIEMLLPEDFLYKLENQLDYSLNMKQRQSLDKILRSRKIKNNYHYEDISAVFMTLGIRDYKTPKGTQNTAHLNYE